MVQLVMPWCTLIYQTHLLTDESAAIPKLAEEAMYACMVYAILAIEKTQTQIHATGC